MKTLHRLLDAAQRYPNAYDGGLATHLPMALHALAGLGADDARLEAWFAMYVARFGDARAAPEVAAPVAEAAVGDWRELRGRADAQPALRA
ncbi:MAG: hypothetical protein KGN16_26695, partial [Burkholderiales bacterium]|nr:hypothetical protein [Burkholderiales bacterium]